MTLAPVMRPVDYNIGERIDQFFCKTKAVYATSLALEKSVHLIELLRRDNNFQFNTANCSILNSDWKLFNSALRCSQFFSHNFSFKGNNLHEKLLTMVKSICSCFIDIVDSIKIISHFDHSFVSHATVELLSVYSNGFALLSFLSSSIKNINKYQDEVFKSLEIEEEIKKNQDLERGNAFNFVLNKNYLMSQRLQDQALFKTFEKVIQCAALVFGFTSYVLVTSILSCMSSTIGLLRLWNKTITFPPIEDLINENTHLIGSHNSQCLEIEEYKDNHAKLQGFLKSTLLNYNELSATKKSLEAKLLAYVNKETNREKPMKEAFTQTDVGSEETFTVKAIFTPAHEIGY